MIKDRAAYARLREADERRALRAMSIEESIALGEALLASSIVSHFARRRQPRPLNLARSLGIPEHRLGRARVGRR